MRTWLALIIAPSLALACQTAMFALVSPECSTQTRIAIHAVAGVSLALAIAFTLLARAEGAPVRFGADEDANDAPATRHFLAVVATAVGALSSLLILCMWIAAWVLSPCLA